MTNTIDKSKLLLTPEDDPIIAQILEVLEKVSVFIRKDGGDIQFKGYWKETGIVFVSVSGACQGCMLIDSTITDGVEAILQQEVKGVNQVKVVDENYNIVDINQNKMGWF